MCLILSFDRARPLDRGGVRAQLVKLDPERSANAIVAATSSGRSLISYTSIPRSSNPRAGHEGCAGMPPIIGCAPLSERGAGTLRRVSLERRLRHYQLVCPTPNRCHESHLTEGQQGNEILVERARDQHAISNASLPGFVSPLRGQARPLCRDSLKQSLRSANMLVGRNA